MDVILRDEQRSSWLLDAQLGEGTHLEKLLTDLLTRWADAVPTRQGEDPDPETWGLTPDAVAEQDAALRLAGGD